VNLGFLLIEMFLFLFAFILLLDKELDNEEEE
jgi:hypothetical protein